MEQNEELNKFEKAIEESFVQDIKKASKAMYQIYSELVNVGFESEIALKLMMSLIAISRRSGDENA